MSAESLEKALDSIQSHTDSGSAILSVAVVSQLGSIYEETHDISEKDYVKNPWGMPFSPLPKYADGFPYINRSAGKSLWGHPLFWIEKKATAATKNEQKNPEIWAARMHFLMQATGTMTDDGWINMLDLVISEMREITENNTLTLEDILSKDKGVVTDEQRDEFEKLAIVRCPSDDLMQKMIEASETLFAKTKSARLDTAEVVKRSLDSVQKASLEINQKEPRGKEVNIDLFNIDPTSYWMPLQLQNILKASVILGSKIQEQKKLGSPVQISKYYTHYVERMDNFIGWIKKSIDEVSTTNMASMKILAGDNVEAYRESCFQISDISSKQKGDVEEYQKEIIPQIFHNGDHDEINSILVDHTEVLLNMRTMIKLAIVSAEENLTKASLGRPISSIDS